MERVRLEKHRYADCMQVGLMKANVFVAAKCH